MKRIKVMVGLLFLCVFSVPAFAQQANTVSAPAAANAAVDTVEKMGTENQESLNDEGYSADDAEYYGAEGTNEEILGEGAKEGTDVGENAVAPDSNAQIPAGNADNSY